MHVVIDGNVTRFAVDTVVPARGNATVCPHPPLRRCPPQQVAKGGKKKTEKVSNTCTRVTAAD